jgi:RadC-like JAB domain
MEMAFLDHEQMRILVLDTKNRVVENISRYQGTVNSSVLRAAEVYRPAVIRNCPAVIICHNHPSGDPTPSPVIWRKICQEQERMIGKTGHPFQRGLRPDSPNLTTKSHPHRLSGHARDLRACASTASSTPFRHPTAVDQSA